jgi:hypothetical protein
MATANHRCKETSNRPRAVNLPHPMEAKAVLPMEMLEAAANLRYTNRDDLAP